MNYVDALRQQIESMTLGLVQALPSLVAGLDVGALAIGFAFRDIFENFLAGVLIMMRE